MALQQQAAGGFPYISSSIALVLTVTGLLFWPAPGNLDDLRIPISLLGEAPGVLAIIRNTP